MPCVACRKYLAIGKHEFLPLMNASHDKLIHHLPLEISSHIFVLSLPTAWDTLPDTERQLARVEASGPLVLAAVCRTWRRIAFSTPRLWTTIPLTLTHSSRRKIILLELLQQWIERSRKLPLSIWISMSQKHLNSWEFDGPVSSYSKVLPNLMSILSSVSQQWRNLDVRGLVEGTDLKLCAKSDIRTPILERVRIWDDNLASNIFGVGQPVYSPTMVSVFSANRMNIRWDEVTTLEWNGYSVNEFLTVLTECRTTILYCAISNYLIMMDQPMNTEKEPICCPNMRSLTIFQPAELDIDHDFLAGLLGEMVLPELRQLQILFPENPLPIHCIVELISRSSCSLISLSLDFGLRDENENVGCNLVKLFKQTPNLVDFNLTWSSISDEMILDLTSFLIFLAEISEQAPTFQEGTATSASITSQFKLVPLLESLILKGTSRLWPTDWRVIVAKIAQRPLKTLKFDFPRPETRHMIPSIWKAKYGHGDLEDISMECDPDGP